MKASDHDGAHVCDCGGAWLGAGDEMVPVAYPGGHATAEEAFAAIFADEPA